MHCHTSKSKTLGLLLLCLVIVGGSYFCTTLPQLKAQIAGWVGLAFFGFCSIAILMQFLRNKVTVTLDETGIHDIRSGFGLIPWADVVSLRIGTVQSQRFLCVGVKDLPAYLAKLSFHKKLLAQANQSLGFAPPTISFTGLSPGLDEVWKYLQANHPEKITA